MRHDTATSSDGEPLISRIGLLFFIAALSTESIQAFLIVPMVGVFFVDIVNALLLQGALKVIVWVS